MMKLWKWLKKKCKCTKRCKCLHCKVWNWAKKTYSSTRDWVWEHLPSTELLKGLGLVAASLWLWFTGSLECTAWFLLLGWGLLELRDYWEWK